MGSFAQRKTSLRYINRKIKKGLCITCDDKPEKGKRYCRKHLDKRSLWLRVYRAKRKTKIQ